MVELSTLSIEDLKRLQAEAQAQIELKERKPGRSRLLQDWHSALDAVLRDEEDIAIPPYPVWQRTQGAKVLRPHVAVAEKLVPSLFRMKAGKKPRRNDLTTGREFIVSMVLSYIRNIIGIPVSMGAACSNLGNCNAAIDASFPNYRRCGTVGIAFHMWVKARAAGVWPP